MIFCATDAHADMVERLLHAAFLDLYGAQYNQVAVKKITGASDKVDTPIRRYKNEVFPSVAITVDLLTTGIDAPAICDLVFLRRVRSRILHEQMMGNHEFNAIAWATPDADSPGQILRTRQGAAGRKNRHQHGAFLAEVQEPVLRDAHFVGV